MNKNKKIISIFITSLFLCGSFFAFGNFISANNNIDHLVISEIQIGGETVYDEFIELYNPNNSEINLENWDVKKKTKSGSESNVLNNIEGIIPAYSYFLIAPRANCGESKTEKCYQGNILADDEYTTNMFLAADNTVLLYDHNGNLIDKIGWGEASDFEGEVVINNPENKQSLERINTNGAVQDTNNNKNDFVLQNNSEPQNSSFVNDNQDIFVDNNNDDDEIPPAPFAKGGDDDDDSGETHPSPFQEGNKIIITEFLPNPEDSDRDNEFIEIYNNGDVKVDLGGWILEDKMGSVKKFIIPDGVEIDAGKYKAFYSDETRIALNNSGDGIILRNKSENIINETQISGAALEEQAFALDGNKNWVWTLRPTPGRGNIIEAEEEADEEKDNFKQDSFSNNDNDDGQDGSTALWDNGANDFDFSDKIIISEIYPNSEGRDNRNGSYEWIELYNDSDRDVNLSGWMIDDILEKGSKAYLIENEIIKARSYKIFDAACTKIALNNTGDKINLLWPDGMVVDKIKYEKADEGLSYNLAKDDSWFWSSVITPEEENKNANVNRNNIVEYNAQDYPDYYSDEEYFVDEEFEDGYGDEESLNMDYVEVGLKDIEHFTKYSRIKTSGIVSTPPGIFSNKAFYISGSGIQVYSYEDEIPNLNVGDEIEIIGKISEIGGEKRILIDRSEDIKTVSSDNLVESKIISTGNINEAFEGCLITVEGKVARTKNDVFYLDDGNGEVKIYIKPQTGIIKPKIEKGDWMVITGQVSQTSAGYRILPRFQGDVKLSRVTGAAKVFGVSGDQKNAENNEEENKKDNFVFYGIMGIIGLAILVDWIRIRMNKKK